MTDIGSRARRRRPGYAWLAVGPVAAAGAIAMELAGAGFAAGAAEGAAIALAGAAAG